MKTLPLFLLFLSTPAIAADPDPQALPPQTAAEAPEPVVNITVSGNLLHVNGATEVPRALFGVHAMALSDERVEEWGIEMERFISRMPDGRNAVISGRNAVVDKEGKERRVGRPAALSSLIECLWDRYQPAVRITRPDWKEYLAGLGTAYGEHARTTGQQHFLEFWNEPYLNWATRPAVNYHGRYYDTSNAVAGAPMRLRTTDEEIPHLVWDRQIFFALNARSRQIDYFASGFIPRGGEPGQTVKLGGGQGEITLEDGAEITLFGPRLLSQEWSGKDSTQEFYWSGEVNRRFYLDMLLPFAEALKATNPEVQLAAGWGFNFFNEDWACWHRLIRPTIAAAHPWIDALHEHHYGGDTRLVAASYEVASAYALAAHGKRLRFWNTEAGGHLDPEQPGAAKSANEGDPLTRARAAMTYFLRDVIHLIATMPDKAVARAAHEPQSNGGDEWAFKLLKPLRGQLLQADSSSPQVWTAAAWNGGQLVLAVFNDASTPVRLALKLPEHAPLALTRREVVPGNSPETAPLRIREERVASSAPQTLGGKSAAVFVAELDANPPPMTTITRTQCVPSTPDVLQKLTADGEVRLSIPVPQASLPAAAARLRLVLSSHPAGLEAEWNGQELTLIPGGAWVVDHPLDPGVVRTQNTLTLRSPCEILVAAASILVDTME